MRCIEAISAALLTAAVLAVAALPLGARPARAADSTIPGVETYRTLCASCHGADAAGDGPAANAFIQPPADLRRIAARRKGRFDRSEIAALIDGRVTAHGSGDMPVWGDQRLRARPGGGAGPSADLAALLTYLESIQLH